jgi:CHAT domain-containing protein
MNASVSTDNPLLRSGLALAGANLDGAASGDSGILTAMEASGLNLWGTKLVTLSACDTGIGEVRNGEGVYGLRRAFVLAGAESLVMSLWPVSDYVTRQMMTAYYAGLRAGLGRGDALREARLAMLRRTSAASGPRSSSSSTHPHRHPYYWASFIQSGDWRGLDDAQPAPAPATSAH